MFFPVEKFERRTREMERFLHVELENLAPFETLEGANGPDEIYNKLPEIFNGMPIELNDFFVGRNRYLWLRKKVKLPDARDGYTVTGLFDFGKTGGGHNSGFESLLFIDGHPCQGVDTFHNDVNLDKFAGKEVEIIFLLWTGLEGGGAHTTFYHQIKRAQIGYLHKAADELYYFYKAIFKTVKLLGDENPEKHALIAAMDRSLAFLNWDVDKFHGTVSQALDSLMGSLEKMEKNSAVTVHCVGHTHIDVAWLWRLKHTREKAMRSFSTALKLMEEFDDYYFLQSQPQLYKYIKSDYPEIYEKIKKKVAGGQWEADGGMWLEADCNITSGESLVRQFLHGISFLREEFGVNCQYLWLPDVFGYSWALPQILRQCNIKTFMTTKISWNQYNTMPNDLFVWRGIDGSEILTYFITTPEVGAAPDSRFATYNGMLSPRSVLGTWKKFRNKDISQDVLISYGYGDGGGGVNRNMLKMRRAMDKLPGLPNVKTGRASEFFDKLHDSVEATDRYVATWDGELYLEYHRGTYTNQAYNKKANRKLENKLSESEWLSSMHYLKEGTYDHETLHEGWETILRNQFHDIIPGSSIREVYEDSKKEYEGVDEALTLLQDKVLSGLTQKNGSVYTLWNFGSFTRREAVFVQEKRSGVFKDEKGRVLDTQKTEDGYWVRVDLAPLSIGSLTFEEGSEFIAAPSPFIVDVAARKLTTPFYSISWNDENELVEIYDLENKRQVLKGKGNALEIFEDKPLAHDAWDIDLFYTQKKEKPMVKAPARLIEQGNLRTVVRFEYAYNASVIQQDMIVYSDSRRIDFATRVDWREDHRLLKTAFEVNVRSTKATYDIQFGHVERPTHYNTSWDYARFEVVGHKWADVSEDNYGVSLLNESKYGYNIKDNVMKLSLLKSSKSPDTQSDMGSHSFTYALYPHAGDFKKGGTLAESTALNLPAGVACGAPLLKEKQLFRLSGEGVIVDAVKKAEKEECLILRVHEAFGGTRSLRITSDLDLIAYAPCNLLEEETGEKITADAIDLTLKPFEIQTLKVWFR